LTQAKKHLRKKGGKLKTPKEKLVEQRQKPPNCRKMKGCSAGVNRLKQQKRKLDMLLPVSNRFLGPMKKKTISETISIKR
jgi:hypothetical protein